MSLPAIPLQEFHQEMVATRRLLEWVPTSHGPWKPHAKSPALGHLAQLVARIPAWIAKTLREPAFDLAAEPRCSLETSWTLLADFDQNAERAREALEQVTGTALDQPWSLKMGTRVLLMAPRGPMARSHFNNLIHHRGQLAVYLRLIDVAVPALYDQTADERM